MTERADGDTPRDPAGEAEVIAYLARHPDLLLRHPDLLGELQVPHESGDAISLIERQVATLRENNRRYEQQTDLLLRNATRSEELSDKLHRFTLQLITRQDPHDLFGPITTALRELFTLDAASIRLRPGLLDAGPDGPTISGKDFATLLDTIGHARSSCHNQLDDALLDSLFGEKAGGVRSCALVALGEPRRSGVLAIGSADPARFNPDCGTLFLNRLGDLLGAYLRAHDLD